MTTAGARQPDLGGLVASVLDGKLRCRTNDGAVRRFAPTELDTELLAIVDAAASLGRPLGLVLPLAGTTAPMLVGAAALIAGVRRTRHLDVEAALVARNLGSRMLYDRLHFGDQQLADFLPRTVVNPDGEVHVIGRPRRDGGGRLHVVTQLDRLRHVGHNLAALVVDDSAATPESMRHLLADSDRPRSIIYITSNPYDPVLEPINESGGVTWAWSPARVAELAEVTTQPRLSAGALIAEPALLVAAGRCPIEVAVCDDPKSEELDAALSSAWRALGSLGAGMSAPATGSRPPEALWWAWGAFNAMAMLPVAPSRYDMWAGGNPYVTKLSETPRIASEFARNASGELARSWMTLSHAFQQVLAAAEGGGRWSGVVSWIHDVIGVGQKGLLVTRNRPAAAATREALEESPLTPLGWQETVRVVTLAELSSGRVEQSVPPLICLPGPVPRRRAGLYVMPPGCGLRIIAAGTFDARRAVAQAAAARTAMAKLEAETINHSVRRLGLPSDPAWSSDGPSDTINITTSRGTIAVDRQSPNSFGSDSGPWEPFNPDVMNLLRRNIESGVLPRDETTAVSTIRSRGEGGTIPVITVQLDHGPDDLDVLVIEPNDLIGRRRDEAIERVAAKGLNPGDVIVLVDHGARRDLLDTVIERLAEAPEYAGLQYLIGFWQTRAARASRTRLTHREILERMQAMGTRVTAEQTVGSWMRGAVDGPRDNLDVARFARAVGDDQLLTEAERIALALETVHGVHRRAGGWLSRRITGAVGIDEQLVIEGDQRLHLSDLMDVVTAHTVVEVDRRLRHAPTVLIGMLTDRGSAAGLPLA